mgnify:CR=1 FL=1
MAVDVLLFTGLAGYSHDTDFLTGEPIYETRGRTSGSYRLATYLREECGLDVEVVDFMFSWTTEEIEEVIKSRIGPNTKLAGVGGLFMIHAPVIQHAFAYIKENYPHVTTCAGSQDVWSISQVQNIDYYVSGYGELGVASIVKGNPIWKWDQIIEGAPKFRHIDCLNTKEYNAFPWTKLSINYQDRDYILPHETLSMETSRGCKFACSYCNFPILGVKGDYTRSAEDFELDLKRNFDKWGTTDYIITDDTFNDYIEKIRKYADVVQSLDFEPSFMGYIRADLMTLRKHDVDELIRMRFNSHLYGIESTNHQSAKTIGKGGKPEIILPRILEAKQRFLKETGFYRGEMSFIWGLPYETPETMQKTLDWLDENWVGEAVSMFQLNIIKAGGITRENDMSRNMHKYGYTIADPATVTRVTDQFDEIFADPEITEYQKERIRSQMPNQNPDHPRFKIHTELWQNEHWDAISAWIEVYKNLFGHKRYYDRGIPAFNQGNWLSVGYTKQDMMKTFRELPSMMNPPREMVKKSIDEYKYKKLS